MNGDEEKCAILRNNEKGTADNIFPNLKQCYTGIEEKVFKNDNMIRQGYHPNQNRQCFINNLTEHFLFVI